MLFVFLSNFWQHAVQPAPNPWLLPAEKKLIANPLKCKFVNLFPFETTFPLSQCLIKYE